jgi:hypothetical protein
MATLAGVAELADALVLGTSSSECGFESLRPHSRFDTCVSIEIELC